MFKRYLISATAAGALLAGAASAQTQATAATDLNLRAEPSPMGEILTVIPADGQVMVEACAETVNWCRVEFEGTTGWAFGDYLTTRIGDETAVLYENRERAQVTTVEVTDTRAASAAGAGTMGAVIGGVLGGPIGIAAGAAIGAGLGAASDPGPQVTSYVVENPVEPVYLEGEVVVGATVPETVELYQVPESEFRYIYVNGVPAVVEPAERRIVTIVR
ncbi:DUF1236 domain-containing protein [Roseitranquillus sediminis]|uniref:DUF1236 domain-containing protein n=1 Tax=Roseitranquillus sediminis TaxID=2809051 RepID=UPI001D0C9B11|nr:DUF1236 domain-containing protein [Roseitranquillus sediminis]MBM9596068.1 DUF1236 domain-containing protein [Roseitranquillus sediminis]